MKKVVLALATLVTSAPAFAETASADAANHATTVFSAAGGGIAIGAGIAMGLAVLGGAIGQSKVAAAALDGSARNPAASNKYTAPLFVGLALIESLVLLAFVIAIQLLGQNGQLLANIFAK